VNNLNPFQRLRRWSNQSLANTFALRAALIAIASSLMVAMISLAVIYWVEQVTLVDRLHEKSQRAAKRIEAAIGIMESAALDLTKNPMFMTALLDSTGRQTYVVPFLQNYKFPLTAASGMALCDINGELLAATRSPLSACRASSPLFKQVITAGNIVRELVMLDNGHAAWTVYQGVIFAYTGTVEGVLVTQLDLNDVLHPLTIDLDVDRVALAHAGQGETLVTAGTVGTSEIPATSIKEARALLFKGKADGVPFPLEVVAGDHLSAFGNKLPALAVGYGLASLLLILLVVYWARRVSQLLIAPLRELTAIAQGVAESGDLTIKVPLTDAGEVGQLAKAFAVMVETLRISEATLENKVALRTEELRKSEAAADAANRAKSEFLATMSHEIRTPMNGILGMAQLLLLPDTSHQERIDYARTILNSGQILLALLNDILDISKIEAGKFELEQVVFDPAQVLDETAALFAEAAHKKGLAIDAHWVGPGQRYRADPTRLRQILSNLVNNALKFSERGQVRIEASEIRRDGEEAQLMFSVSDTGIGISPEQQALLFKPFSQVDASTTRRYGGTGLGLSIVRSLARLMGGEVGVESEAGHGARFWFSIRATVMQPTEDSRHEARPAKVGAGETALRLQSAKLTGRILVVDDNPTNRLVAETMLGKLGLHSESVEDGRQAVDAITAGMAVDLVLMDCQMPVMDGYEATRKIRQWESEQARPHLPIVALTAGAFEEDRRHCIAAGMDDFLAKPIGINELTAMLERWQFRQTVSASAMPQDDKLDDKPEPDNPLPVFDAQLLLKQMGDDRDLATTIIKSAMSDLPGYFTRLEQIVAAGSWQEAERLTHTLKGLTAQIGGVRISRRLKDVNGRLKGGGEIDSATAVDLFNEYQTLARDLLEWMQ
jgi:signal transduction histidine kinase/CheY-like chemotaxis protein/HPt (histidine-containing phosphotransfer) domain-containing protein